MLIEGEYVDVVEATWCVRRARRRLTLVRRLDQAALTAGRKRTDDLAGKRE